MNQFGRETEVRVADLTFKTPDLYMEFAVPFDDDLEPNESEIRIWNLSWDTINRIKYNAVVSLTAGYRGDVGVILTGRVSNVATRPDGADQVTTINIMDGPDLSEKKAIQKAYAGGTKAETILRDLIRQLGLPVALFKLPRNPIYAEGLSIDGKIIDQINDVAKDAGAHVFINKGRIFVGDLTTGQDSRFTLSADTGLIGSPESFQEDDAKGWKVRCLLQHRITTASIIRLDSKMVQGTFRVRKGSHNSSGEDFVTEMEVI